MLDLLTALVDQSLVVVEARPRAIRYRLLESIQAYLAERLEASGEADAVRMRHWQWCHWLAAESERHAADGERLSWLMRLDAELDNLRTALAWQPADDATAGLRLATLLWRFWLQRGQMTEGRYWLETARRRAPEEPSDLRAGALTALGALAVAQGDYAYAKVCLEESIAWWRPRGNAPGLAQCLNVLGTLAHRQGDFDRAVACHTESLELWRGIGDKRHIEIALNNLALAVHALGDYERAAAMQEECLAMCRALGNQHGVAGSLNNLGSVLLDQGDYQRARHRYGEALEIYRTLGDRRGAAIALNGLGLAAMRLGDEACVRALRESLELRVAIADKLGIAKSLESLAALAGWQRHAEAAARLAGAADALRRAIQAPRVPSEARWYGHVLTAARTALGEDVFTSSHAGEASLSLEAAIAFARETFAQAPATEMQQGGTMPAPDVVGAPELVAATGPRPEMSGAPAP